MNIFKGLRDIGDVFNKKKCKKNKIKKKSQISQKVPKEMNFLMHNFLK